MIILDQSKCFNLKKVKEKIMNNLDSIRFNLIEESKMGYKDEAYVSFFYSIIEEDFSWSGVPLFSYGPFFINESSLDNLEKAIDEQLDLYYQLRTKNIINDSKIIVKSYTDICHFKSMVSRHSFVYYELDDQSLINALILSDIGKKTVKKNFEFFYNLINNIDSDILFIDLKALKPAFNTIIKKVVINKLKDGSWDPTNEYKYRWIKKKYDTSFVKEVNRLREEMI